MSALVLKILAIVFMFFDHIGFAIGSFGSKAISLGGGYYFLRAVGRLSMPIFAFLIANGFKHTSNVKKYALRLFVFALISEVPFDYFVNGKPTFFESGGRIPNLAFDNVFFTLFLGLCFLWLNDIYKKHNIKYSKLVSVLTFIILAFVAGFISADYSVVGVAWVALFGTVDLTDKKKLPVAFFGAAILSYWRIIGRCILVIVYRLTRIHVGKIPGLVYFFAGKITVISWLQPIALVSLGLLLLYNGKSGMPENKKMRMAVQYAFYLFYPLHILVLYFIF